MDRGDLERIVKKGDPSLLKPFFRERAEEVFNLLPHLLKLYADLVRVGLTLRKTEEGLSIHAWVVREGKDYLPLIYPFKRDTPPNRFISIGAVLNKEKGWAIPLKEMKENR